MKIVGNSATKNSLYMRFGLILRTDSHHPWRISWRIIKRNIFPWLVNIGVASCSPLRSNITGKGHQTVSRGLQPQKRHTILKAMNLLGFRVRRGIGLISFLTEKRRVKRRPSIKVHSAIAYFVRSQEFQSKSICRISLRTVLESVTTNSPSRIDWKEP